MTEAAGVRPKLGDAIREVFDQEYFKSLAEEVKGLSKGAWVDAEVECKSCGEKTRKKVQVSVPDYPRIVQAVTELMEQAEGKPGTAGVEDAGTVLVVERNWPGA